VVDLASQLNAASTVLDYHIDGHDQVYLDHERLQGEDQTTISEPAQLYLGQSSVTIRPSQRNLTGIKEQYHDQQSKLHQALSQVGAASVEEAEGHWRKLNEMKQQVETLSAQLTTYAPNGLDQLEAEFNS